MSDALKIWDDTLLKFSKTTDGLGMPIDPLILEPVVALNVLGVSTSGSCEGHIVYDSNSPWIDIDDHREEDKKAYSRLLSLARQANASQLPDIERLITRHDLDKHKQEILQRQLLLMEKLQGYLTLFYQAHTTSYENILNIQGIVLTGFLSSARLQCIGSLTQDIHPLEIQTQRLKAFQEEFSAFGRFLKEMFLSGKGLK